MPETEDLVIRKNPSLQPSEDYEALRKAGIGYIEALGRALWTDYNTHDPGITLLEVLCYGITDLGYRTSHETRDLLTRDVKGVPTLIGNFHPAHEILTSGPITFLDLRKLLVDIEGVRHAWVEQQRSVVYCLDEVKKALYDCLDPSGEDKLTHLNGLYDVYVELEEDVDDLSVGIPDNGEGAGSFMSPEKGSIRFSVDRELVIREVSVYVECPGEVIVTLLDSEGAEVLPPVSAYIDRENVKRTISLDFFVTPPDDLRRNYYFLSASGSGVKLYSSIDAEFPFELEGLIRLLPGLDRDETYYYFYDWVVDYATEGMGGVPESYRTRARAGLRDHGRYIGEYLSPDGKAILFDVESDLFLDGVYVYGHDRGELEVVLLDDSGNEVVRHRVRIQEAGEKTWVPLNVALETAQHYRMKAESDKVRLYANREVAFPYLVEAAVTLIGGEKDGLLGQNYYFFYDWEISYDRPVGLNVPELPSSRSAVLAKVRDRIMRRRNLCEDLISIKELKPEEVGLCARVDVHPEADIDEILAEIFFLMEEHVKPSVKFYTLEQLRAEPKNKSIDEIFDGPRLDHGFIDADELASIERAKDLRASDIIHIIADIEGVKAVRDVTIVSFVDGVKENEQQWIWCPTEKPCRVPNFEPDRSNIVFYKKGLPYYPDLDEVDDLLSERRLRDLRVRSQTSQDPLPVPVGEDMQLDDYYPVQNDLPLNYMVGRYQVPASESVLRHAQSNQLKAFLLFFEQLLANYLAQLERVPELFSWKINGELTDIEAVRTYFTQQIDANEIAHLDTIYLDYEALPVKLDEIIEDEKTAIDRKLRLLEHLLARFGESFTDYSLTLFRVLGNDSSSQLRLIQDKIAYLEHYPQASANRAKGHDYRYPGDEANISGYQQRVYRMLGFRDIRRKTLAGHFIRIVQRLDGQWCFVMEDERGRRLFESVCCPTKAAVETMVEFVMSHFPSFAGFRYEVRECDGVDQLVRICKKTGCADVVGDFASDCAIDDVWEELSTCSEAEGFHIVEHILLRKRQAGDRFLPVQLIDCQCGDCDAGYCDTSCIEVRDPYSFRASIVLPAWSRRFYDPRFRVHVEQVLRQEAPAHVHLRICWIGHEAMREFETCYCKWEEELACLDAGLTGAHPYSTRVPADYADYQAALEALIDKLFRLEQRYPAARLHDCETGDSDMPPVILGSANLTSV